MTSSFLPATKLLRLKQNQKLTYELHPSPIHCLWPVLQGQWSCYGHCRNKPLYKPRKAVDLNNRVDCPRSGENCMGKI